MDAFEQYKSARVEYDSANQRYQEASRERTAALNNLNEAQKKFDEWVKGIKSNSPRDSDWSRPRGELCE